MTMWLVATTGTDSSKLTQNRRRNIPTSCPACAPCPPCECCPPWPCAAGAGGGASRPSVLVSCSIMGGTIPPQGIDGKVEIAPLLGAVAAPDHASLWRVQDTVSVAPPEVPSSRRGP